MVDVIAIAQKVGNRAYERELPNRYEAAKAYTVNVQAALERLREIERRDQAPSEMFDALVDAGEDPSRAAHLVDIEFGFTEPPPNPFSPRWDKLAEDEPVTQWQDSMDSAEEPSIQ